MTLQEYIDNSKMLLERIKEDIDKPAALNVAVLVQKVGKEKYYIDYAFITRSMPIEANRKEKKKIEIMPLRLLQTFLQEVVSCEA